MPIEVELPNGQIAEFPDSMQPEEIQAVLRRQFNFQEPQEAEQDDISAASPRAARAARSQRSREAKVEEFLSELEQANPFQAQALRDMNPFQRALIGAGAGFADLLTAVGARERSPAEERATQEIAGSGESFGVGRAIGQAAPFAGAGVVAGSALRTAPLAAQALTQGAIGATEGALVAKGTGGDAEDVLAGAAIGGTLGAGGEVLTPVISRAARALVRRVKGKEPSGILIDDAGQPTKELQDALDESGQTFDDLVEESRGNVAQEVVESGRRGDVEAAGSIEVDPRRLEAAERIGIADQAPLGVLTSDQAAQELTGALAAVPGTQQSAALDAFADEFGRRADSYVEDIGGSLDRGFVDQQLLNNMQSDIGRIKAVEDVLYDRIRSNIGEGTIVNAKQLKNLLSARGRTRRGIKNLSKVERDVFDRVKDGKISYAELDDVISDIGAAIGRETDAYSTVQRSKLNDMYSKLSQLREGVAETFGQKNNLQRAKRIGADRFGLQESTQALFGRDLQRSIFPRIDSAVKRIDKGNIREFESIMEQIPEKYRKPVAATMLNTAMTGGRNQSLGVNATQFSNWYKNLSRNETAMKSLRKYIGEDEMKRLDDFAEIAKGLSGVKSGRVRTGVTSEAFKRLDDVGGIANKLYSVGQAVDRVPGGALIGTPAVTIGNIAKLAVREKTPAVEAADSLMSSKAFRDAVIAARREGVDSSQYKRMSSRLKQTPAYKNYIKQLDQSTASAVASAGLIPWLASEEEEN